MRGSVRLGVLLGLLTFAAIGCSNGGNDRITVVAASSLEGTLDEISADWTAISGIDVEISYAGSQTLAAQVRGGFPADVAIIANQRIIDELTSSGALSDEATVVATTSVVLAFGDDVGVVALGELGSTDLVLVLADPAVPLGQYSREAIIRADLDPEDLHPASLETSAAATVTRLRTGDADVALIYAVDGGEFNITELDSPTVVYLAAPLEGSGSDAREFIVFLRSDVGSQRLIASGFGTP